MVTSLVMRSLGILIVGVLSACGGSKPTETTLPPPPSGESTQSAAPVKSLFERLGGLPAIQTVVHELVTLTTADPRIKERFFNVEPASLEKELVDFVCVATGGPCKYTGKDMVTAHGGMELVEEEFDALVENLVTVLDQLGVPAKEKGELLGALGPLKPQIVTPAGKLKPIDDAKLAAVTKLQRTLKDAKAAELLGLAVQAGKRGQRNYAEQLFSRVEIELGAKAVASVASVFREGAPTRISTKPKPIDDPGPQGAMPPAEEEPPPPPKVKTGSLAGTLQIDGKPPQGLGVITLTPVKGPYKKRVPKLRIVEQRGKQFAPHVMAIPVGSTVSFPNFDPILHNVFSISKTKAFDLGMYKRGETREVKFDKPGIVRLGCNLHAAMSAYLIVVEAPHYVVVDTDGKFRFKTLKPGTYKVQVWNELAGDPITAEVVIEEGENTRDFDLKSSPPGISPDKFGTPRT